MAMWASRTSGYKVGILLLCVGSVFYSIGYASPFWLSDHSYKFSGLWQACGFSNSDSATVCSTRPQSADVHRENLFKAVQALQTIGLIGVIVSLMYAGYVNCCLVRESHSRVLEMTSALSGMCGFIGCLLFVIWKQMKPPTIDEYLGWAFGFNMAGCLVIMFNIIVIAISNRVDSARSDITGLVQGGNPVVMPTVWSVP
ncbi:uncharacterized protein LOC143275337 [Babylonia areolata]|uniref:uncharacterized protein LOC143275337 n=1 Tax=Babylonia areolata TaxID=304850 RepID=UPI003FCF0ACE